MAPLLVRLNLPGFSSPEPFHLAVAPRSLAGLACAVLEEIGGLTREELQGVRDDPSRVPLSFLGEVAHSEQPVLLSSDAELGSFLATSAASLQGAPPTIEVRPPEPSVPPAAADVAPPSPFSHRAGTNGAGSAAACSGPEDGAAGFSPAARPATAEKARVPNGAAGTRPRDAQPPKRGAATRASSSGAAPAADPRASPGRAGGRGPAARASPAQAPPREGAAAPGGAGLRTPDPARHAPQQRAIARTSSSPSLGQRPGWEAAAGRPRHDLPAARWGAAAPAPEGARGAQGPQAAAAGQGQAARRPLERAAAAEGRPETSPPASAAVAAAPDVSGNSANSLGADRHAWVRLYYQDTEARRQRAEEAKRRAQEREEEEIRTSARRAMGRPEGRPSAGPRGDRGAGRDPDTTADLSRSSPARRR
ncbi:unnamed protein product [Prorocentrum cordatum]|uniref:Uncharacterized protein n=1 Tax=Prorocentrum cordatum TaxID=2364126 RepID=A0ABN9S1T3_9DINO|nr:unnamed protein product [Polarella glacialis]